MSKMKTQEEIEIRLAECEKQYEELDGKSENNADQMICEEYEVLDALETEIGVLKWVLGLEE